MQTLSRTPLSSRISGSPWLPSELVSHIITELWDAPQSTESRSELFKSLCQVSKTWLALFLRVAMRDVHLPCLDAKAYLRVIPQRTNYDLFTLEASQNADRCRSITFYVDGRAPEALDHDGESELKIYSGVDPACNAISNVLSAITTADSLPNLRHITIKYIDWGYENIFDQIRYNPFPPQVTRLSIDYAFSNGAIAPLTSYLRNTYARQPQEPRTILPNVRYLSMSGVPSEVVVDMLKVCPNVETLEIINASNLSVLAPLPPSVRTIVMRYPWWPMGVEEMSWWTLGEAVRKGLFHPGTRPQVILRSDTPNPWCFVPNWGLCKYYGIDLVYDRDESCTW